MCKIWKHLGIGITCTALFCSFMFAADPPVTVLNIELANEAIYTGDVSDYSKLASDPNPVSPAQPSNRNFGTAIVIADIVMVNGKQASQRHDDRAHTCHSAVPESYRWSGHGRHNTFRHL